MTRAALRNAVTAAAAAGLFLALGGCKWPWEADDDTVSRGDTQLFSAAEGIGPPLGGLPGGWKITGEPNMPNPLGSGGEAAQEGHRLYLAMNCASCHGYKAKGAMGPDLTDKQWRYAGMPAAIFNSIAQGRPQGMPSWGGTLPASEIWKIVSFIETLGGAYEPGQYNASLQGDTEGMTVADGYRQLEALMSDIGGSPAPTSGLAAAPKASPAPAAGAEKPSPAGADP